jgi:ferredoxin
VSGMRVVADRDLCVGAGMCVVSAPAVFDQDDGDGLVVVLTAEPAESEAAAVREAVALCPSGAISIVDD